VRRRRGRREARRAPILRAHEGTVGHQNVKMRVEVQRPTKPLHEGDRVGLHPLTGPVPAHLRAQVLADRLEDNPRDLREQRTVPRCGLAQRPRERQNPMAHRDFGHLPAHQLRRGLAHATPAARVARPASLAREGHGVVSATARAPCPREAVREHAASQVDVELVVHVARQRRAVHRRGLDHRQRLGPPDAPQRVRPRGAPGVRAGWRSVGHRGALREERASRSSSRNLTRTHLAHGEVATPSPPLITRKALSQGRGAGRSGRTRVTRPRGARRRTDRAERTGSGRENLGGDWASSATRPTQRRGLSSRSAPR
jgi:hypothetical protein